MGTQTPDYYELLGVSRNATAKEIKAAYRSQVAQYHPDKHEDNNLKDLARERLAQLNAAYEVLKDPKKRRIYDAELAAGPSANPFLNTSAIDPQNAPPRFLRPILTLLGLAGFTILLKYLRNPRVWAFVAIGTAVVWGISIIRRRRKK